MIKKRIQQLREKFKYLNIQGYVVPKNDEFFSEYAVKDRLNIISNFSGSAGLAVILKLNNYLFVDGRYTIQAKKESGNNFKIIEIHKTLPYKIMKNIKLGFDPSLFTKKQLKILFKKSVNLVPVNENLIDQIYKAKIYKTKPFFSLDDKIVGESSKSKVNKIAKYLKKYKSDYLFISAPENVAWVLNIRGNDNPNSPIPNCHLIISNKKKMFLISNKKKAAKIISSKKIQSNYVFETNKFSNLIKKLKGKKFIIDAKSCSVSNEEIIKSSFKVLKKDDPCYEFKSIKNPVEINHMVKAHFEDGLALTKFIFWIKNINKKEITEVEAQNKLEKFRKLSKKYLYPSFNTIAGSGANGAIVHYRASKKDSKIIKKNDIFLCDSGGQYKFGTTDVTRTICFSQQKKNIKKIFTKVLKGHIAVVQTNLNKINIGKKIDLRARKFLKEIGLDYEHGTGHGVGFFLNVHEGPQSISKYNSVKFKEGMILSNEPGYYKKGEYGIRIENLVYVKRNNNKLFFENLTFAPIEKELINESLLSEKEKDYLFMYHLDIYSKYSKLLNQKERKWLASLI